MKYWLTLVVLVLMSFTAYAQTKDPGKVEIIKDERVNDLMDLYRVEDAKKPGVEGYRIQIYSSGKRGEAQKIKDQVYNEFPSMRPVLQYQAPNFKLRVGAYRSRLEAFKDLQELAITFPNAFIVKDDLGLAELEK